MSGSIDVDGATWSASSWLFVWVLNSIADGSATTEKLASTLHEIVIEDLGWLSLSDLERAMIESWIENRLSAEAASVLPRELPERAGLRASGSAN